MLHLSLELGSAIIERKKPRNPNFVRFRPIQCEEPGTSSLFFTVASKWEGEAVHEQPGDSSAGLCVQPRHQEIS